MRTSNALFATSSAILLVASCSPTGRVGDDVFGTNSASVTASASGGTDATGASGASGASGGTASASGGTESSGGATTGDSDSDGIKFDTPGGASTAGDSGGGSCGCGNSDWSYVWIANSSEGTVSKINTRTLTEEGRYLTRATNGSPSRTSVSVDARAMVVANRHVGLTKIWARAADCAGANTSSGPGDVKAWGSDDCVDWAIDFPGKSVQRPVAWTPGTLNPATCEYDNQQVWTTTGSGGISAGQCGPNGITVHLVNGDSGAIDDEVVIPETEFNCDHTNTGQGVGLGPYGGAVDNEGNFWFHGFGNNKLVRVELASMTYTITGGGNYGITVDTEGRVWTNSIRRYDPGSNQWANPVGGNAGQNGGVAQDLQGRIWAAEANGVTWVDMETMAVGDTVALPFQGQAKGVSVDIDGYIWAAFQGDTRAYRIDPDTYAIETVTGLNDPYTYSDMTGGQLSNVNCNPPEG